MTIEVGERLPAGKFTIMRADGPGSVSVEEVFAGRTVVLFCVPGAFTPTCSREHLPGYVELADRFRSGGADTVACLAVNDIFVMSAWSKQNGADQKVLMLADGNGDYARALGLELDARDFGLGLRAHRFAMIVQDGIVKALEVEKFGEFKVSDAQSLLEKLGALRLTNQGRVPQ